MCDPKKIKLIILTHNKGDYMTDFIYTDSKKREISFPLGGIGSGCIGLSGNGRLREWEIFNRPNKDGINGFSHFAIKAEQKGKILDARILNGEYEQSYIGKGKRQFHGIGFGVESESMAGIPHFHDVEFKGEFPIAELKFNDDEFPAKIKMTAFNPFIPLNEDDSSIPGAFFEIEIENNAKETIDYTICLTVKNPSSPIGVNNEHSFEDGFHLMKLQTTHLRKSHVKYGDLTIATDINEVSCQENWFQGDWYDGLAVFWNDFTTPGKLKNRKITFPKPAGLYKKVRIISSSCAPHASLAAHVKILPGKKEKVRFITTWNYPNCYNYQKFPPRGAINELRKINPNFLTTDRFNIPDMDEYLTKWSRPVTWKNYYAVLFKNSKNSALYSMKNWDRLYKETLEFKNALFTSTLPHEVIDAVSANISILKSPTVLRLQDGAFWGWEGCNATAGCCPGSCTHVWNYAYALPFLFPKLERSMRDLDYKYNLRKSGLMTFRLTLPLRKRGLVKYLTTGNLACCDGQFGNVIKVYRDWKISGDTEWLKSHWESVKKSLEYAWSEKNKHRWDRNRDGVMEGRQHHTLDVEAFGPNSYLTGFYLAALKAASEMADIIGEHQKSEEYVELFKSGKAWVDKNLFNGEYYYHKINLEDKSILSLYPGAENQYWNEEAHEIKYQLGEACHIDQVLAQWHSNLIGLGEIFDNQQTKSALSSIYKYNFKPSLKKHYNPCRVFALEEEGGVVMAEWPEGKRRPVIASPYAEEVMAGFEYQAAIHMIQVGLIDEGLEIVKTIRKRYTGEKRNPWSEIECGSNYSRSMASYGLLLAFSGFKYNLVEGMIGFNPIATDGYFKSFWALGFGWGVFKMNSEQIELTITQGSLTLNEIHLPFLQKIIRSITLGKAKIEFNKNDGIIKFRSQIEIDSDNPLLITLS